MVINGIALKEVRAWDGDADEAAIEAAVAACATAFGDDWDGTPSLLQHVMVQVQHKGDLTDALVTAVKDLDKDTIDAALDASSFDEEIKGILKGRVQLHWDDVVLAPDPTAVSVGPVVEADLLDDPAPGEEPAAAEEV